LIINFGGKRIFLYNLIFSSIISHGLFKLLEISNLSFIKYDNSLDFSSKYCGLGHKVPAIGAELSFFLFIE
jgi:hypothetical protein